MILFLIGSEGAHLRLTFRMREEKELDIAKEKKIESLLDCMSVPLPASMGCCQRYNGVHSDIGSGGLM